MIFIAAMLLCAWIQTHNDNTPAWVYAAVLALGNAAYAIFTGGDLVANAILAGILFLYLWLYYFLLDYFSENVLGWWVIMLAGAAGMYLAPLALLSLISKVVQ